MGIYIFLISYVSLCSFLLTYILSFLLGEMLVFMLLNSGWLPMLLLYFWLIHSYLKLLTAVMNCSSLFRASLVAQIVKNLPAVQETWVWSLGWEDPLVREWQLTPVFLPEEFHGQRSLVGYTPWRHKELDTTLSH